MERAARTAARVTMTLFVGFALAIVLPALGVGRLAALVASLSAMALAFGAACAAERRTR